MTPSRAVAFYLPSLSGGGAEKMILHMAGELHARGLAVDVVLARSDGAYAGRVPAGVNVVNLNARGTMSRLMSLKRYLQVSSPEALVTALDVINIGAIAKRLSGVPTRIVLTIRNHLSSEMADLPRHTRTAKRLIIRATYGLADAVVGISEGVADDVARLGGLDRSSVGVLYNPVVVPSMLEEARAEPPHPWLCDDGAPVILGVGRLVPQKDFATLIHAFHRVHQSRPSRLLILGEGPLRGDLLRLVESLGLSDSVRMPGFLANPYACMSAADVFVLSSRFEGFGNVLVEAMACGTTVVSTDCPSGPAEILAGGRFGKLVPVGDAEGMAGAIVQSLDEPMPRETLSDRAGHFTAAGACDRLLEIIRSDRAGVLGAAVGG